ncbi:MAG: hypothetical protein ACOCPW_01380, partial [Marinilabiliaceae bacterium]
LIAGCQHSSKDAGFSNHPPEGQDSIAWINNWSVIGPFGYDTLQQTAKEAFYNKDLENYGIEVPDFTFADFSKFEQNPEMLRHIVTKDEFLDFIKLSSDSTKGGYYWLPATRKIFVDLPSFHQSFLNLNRKIWLTSGVKKYTSIMADMIQIPPSKKHGIL